MSSCDSDLLHSLGIFSMQFDLRPREELPPYAFRIYCNGAYAAPRRAITPYSERYASDLQSEVTRQRIPPHSVRLTRSGWHQLTTNALHSSSEKDGLQCLSQYP